MLLVKHGCYYESLLWSNKVEHKIIVLWDEGHLQKFTAGLIHAEIE